MKAAAYVTEGTRGDGPVLTASLCSALALVAGIVVGPPRLARAAAPPPATKPDGQLVERTEQRTTTIRARLVGPSGQAISNRHVSIGSKEVVRPPNAFGTVATDQNGCLVFTGAPCRPCWIAIMGKTGSPDARCRLPDLSRSGTYDVKLTLDGSRRGQPSLDIKLLAVPPSSPRRRRIPLLAEEPFMLGPGWDVPRLKDALSKNLADLARQHLPDCQVQLPSDKELRHYPSTVIRVLYHTQEHSVVRRVSKAVTNNRTTRRTEVGPRPDGLILWVWLHGALDQAVRPQTIDKGPWRVYLGEVRVSDLKTYVKVNLSFGPKTDRSVLALLSDPIPWLEAIKIR
jgi:hypothetical protein